MEAADLATNAEPATLFNHRLCCRYDGTVRNSGGNVIQFLYGEDGMDGCAIESQKLAMHTLDEPKFRVRTHAPKLGSKYCAELASAWGTIVQMQHMLRLIQQFFLDCSACTALSCPAQPELHALEG